MAALSDLRKTALEPFSRTIVDPKAGGVDEQGAASGEPPALRGGGDASAASPLAASEAAAAWDALGPDTVRLPAEGDVVGEHYRLVRLLGQGMFGKVYVAQRVDVPEHQVALKLVPRSVYLGRNVERELVMLATVGHPNVVSLKDHGTTPEYVWLTMPVYSGETLAERLEQAPLALEEAYDVFVAVARGLEALHDAGLRHQDVKPENIFLARFGSVVQPILLDLGVAAEIDATFVAGTALYASPEQLAVLSGYPGAYPLCAKMDTYCLASTLLRSLVGAAFFPGEEAKTRDEMVAAQEARASEPLAAGALPAMAGEPRNRLAAAFRKWLAFEPSDRPTVSALADELDLLHEPAREIERLDAARRRQQRASVARLRAVVGGFALVALAGGAYVYAKRHTIALAGELERARKEGAASFDRLDTCKVGFKLAQEQVAACRAERTRAEEDFKASLDNVMKSGTRAEQDRARELRALHARLKASEERGETDRRRADDDARRVAGEFERAAERLNVEREREHRAAEAARAELVAITAERDRARADAHGAEEERDACKAAQTKPAATALAPPAPAASATPAAP